MRQRRRRTTTTTGSDLSSGRRVARPRDVDVLAHHGGVLPRRPDADAARAHAAAPARPPAALPVLALRGRPRRPHAQPPAERALARGALRVALRDAQRGQREAGKARVRLCARGRAVEGWAEGREL